MAIETSNWKFGWILPYIKQFKVVKRWAQEGLVDIVEAPDSRGWFAFWPKLTIPLIIRSNGSNTYFARILGSSINRLTNFLEQKSYSRANAIISASKYTANITKAVFKIRLEFAIIYNGIEIPELTLDNVRDNNRVIFSGSLTRKKGIFKLIESFLIVLEKNNKATLEIYGKDTFDDKFGSVRENLMKIIPLKWKDHIIFKGHVTRNELFFVYRTASVAVFPSFAEAFAFAPMESMVCECPTIFMKLGSGPELINDGIDGLLVDPGNPEEIASAILKLIEDPSFAYEIGRNGRKKIIEKFSFHVMVSKSIEYYQDTINNFDNGNTLKEPK